MNKIKDDLDKEEVSKLLKGVLRECNEINEQKEMIEIVRQTHPELVNMFLTDEWSNTLQ